MLNKIHTDNAPQAIGPYSQAITVGEMVFTSGQIPLNPKTGTLVGEDICSQTRQACENLGEVLKASGSSFENVVKTVCFLQNMEDFAQFNQVYAEYFTEKPARSCVAVKELPKGALVEIEAIAEISKK